MKILDLRISILRICVAGLLTAIGILVPMFMPIRVIIEPASFTLASHVVIFLGMFISPFVGILVTLGTTFGFLLAGFPIVIVLRAASHIVFVVLGAMYLQRIDKFAISGLRLRLFSFVIGIIHGIVEFFVVMWFWFGMSGMEIITGNMILIQGLVLVGFGTLVHSMVDFEVANVVRLALQKQKAYLKLAKNP